MGWSTQFFQNKVLLCTLVAWIVAQTLKVLLAARRQRQFDVRWFLGTGGMPSAHSAGVAALATGVGLQMGFHTPGFAVALLFAVVTMFDAQGVRRATGRQATLLNKIISEVYTSGQVSEERVKELIGHTPVEVMVGAGIGCLTALWMCRP